MEINFPKREKQILRYWKENQIFEKSVSQRKKAKDFVFYEGPPTANGKPGIHHVGSRVFKDIICRYKTMQGFRVQRKAGWDTHGLPVELEVEKKLGLKNKKDIESYGIARFNKKCRESVWQYLKDWKKLTERIGFWLDLENPYITYETNYIESVWFVIKQIFKKGLLYLGYKVVPYCPRCGTSLSSHEVAQGYERIKEPSIFIKFRIKNPEFENTFLLVWTTTPWTLPGNVAVAVNPKFIYVKVKAGSENFILAKERQEACGQKDAEILQELKGEELLKIYYEAPYPVDSQEGVTIYKVIPADFVSLEDGTGLVHIAPAFGEDDMAAIKTQNSKIKNQNELDFPILLPVDEAGKFRLEAKKWAGIFVKDADPLIIEDLRSSNLLYKEELYEHDYPFCWRCKSPLLYYAKQGWFINMQEEIKENLIKNNQEVNWVPAHLKEGRFGEWLKGVKDWAISRERYWGTPLPIWKCKTCGTLEAIGSRKDLVLQRFSQNKYFVLRHGEYPGNVNKIANCWPEKTPLFLTKKGKGQIKRAAGKLKKEKIDLIFSSDLSRTKQTAEIVAKELGLTVKFDKRLREENVGIFNGKPVKEFGRYIDPEKKLSPLEFYGGLFKSAPPESEDYVDIEKRMFSFIKNADKKYPGKNILIVSHERPITLLEKILSGQSLEEFVDVLVRKKDIKLGEVRELEFTKLPYNKKMELDFHKPYIDEVKFYCPKCGGQSERALEVIDCWFDSGSMPFAQGHWPFDAASSSVKAPADKQGKPFNLKPPKLFPADYISEAIDQTRGWFYTLLATSTLLGFEAPYKNVISLGHVLDEKGEKMSKSKGNIVDPWYIIEKYGADAARWYFYTINQPGEPKLFTEKDIDGVLKKFILTFWNCYTFFETYRNNVKIKSPSNALASLGRSPATGEAAGKQNAKLKTKNILDKWIISKLNETIGAVTGALDKYDVTLAARAIEKFSIEELSLWYIRRSRKRFQRPENPAQAKEASVVLGFVLFSINKLVSPFLPFVSEEIYQKITGAGFDKKKSVHLEEWPESQGKLINKKLNEDMEKAREIVAQALAERAKAAIKVRQPLARLKVKNSKFKVGKDLLDLIKEEINVKEVVFDQNLQKEVELDTEITPKLKEEGIVREVVRNIQEMRKKSNLKPKDNIFVRYSGDAFLEEILKKNEKAILEEGKIKDFLPGPGAEGFKIQQEVAVDGKKILISIKKIILR
ncbi:MAG: class I tRNA ligase family protein [Patescibacteria group bacterium]